MNNFKVTRAQLKIACEEKNWDLLDKLLEIDNSKINDNALFTDGWGDWWGLLLQAVMFESVDGVKVLLKHGAKRKQPSWGDGIPVKPLELAKDNPKITALLKSTKRPEYQRKTEPKLPQGETTEEKLINRQGEIREQSGLVFQTPATNLRRDI